MNDTRIAFPAGAASIAEWQVDGDSVSRRYIGTDHNTHGLFVPNNSDQEIRYSMAVDNR